MYLIYNKIRKNIQNVNSYYSFHGHGVQIYIYFIKIIKNSYFDINLVL